jgi:hypothetical protein
MEEWIAYICHLTFYIFHPNQKSSYEYLYRLKLIALISLTGTLIGNFKTWCKG